MPIALRGIIAGACLGAIAVGGAAGVATSDPASRGIGAILPGGNLATAIAGPHHPMRSARATPAGAVLSHAVHTRLCFEMLLIAIVDKRIQSIDAFGHHIASSAAISTVRSAKFNKFFSTE